MYPFFIILFLSFFLLFLFSNPHFTFHNYLLHLLFSSFFLPPPAPLPPFSVLPFSSSLISLILFSCSFPSSFSSSSSPPNPNPPPPSLSSSLPSPPPPPPPLLLLLLLLISSLLPPLASRPPPLTFPSVQPPPKHLLLTCTRTGPSAPSPSSPSPSPPLPISLSPLSSPSPPLPPSPSLPFSFVSLASPSTAQLTCSLFLPLGPFSLSFPPSPTFLPSLLSPFPINQYLPSFLSILSLSSLLPYSLHLLHIFFSIPPSLSTLPSSPLALLFLPFPLPTSFSPSLHLSLPSFPPIPPSISSSHLPSSNHPFPTRLLNLNYPFPPSLPPFPSIPPFFPPPTFSPSLPPFPPLLPPPTHLPSLPPFAPSPHLPHLISPSLPSFPPPSLPSASSLFTPPCTYNRRGVNGSQIIRTVLDLRTEARAAIGSVERGSVVAVFLAWCCVRWARADQTKRAIGKRQPALIPFFPAPKAALAPPAGAAKGSRLRHVPSPHGSRWLMGGFGLSCARGSGVKG
ncbi:hypothetical protein C7M84_012097 [Penaeus vannamei]|uniref:Uncharacterized protein n=1 Tax=Penaeus vannamei TaxID=6689 RepID=A0A423SZK0_PENVA|nr:hypothetical protein C7M84_012097 [Penaeus vannamei]